MIEATNRSAMDEGIGPGEVLRDLLLPMDPKEFIEECWETKTVLLRHPSRQSTPLMRLARGTREQWLQALATPAAEQIGLLGFRAEDFPKANRILPSEASHMVGSGGTVYSMEIQQCVPGLATLMNRLKADLDYPGPIASDGFWSSRGFGLDLHYDLTTAFTLQLEGSKSWRIGRRPSVPGPRERGFALAGRCYTVGGVALPTPEPAEFMEVVLSPGDVLYVPAGTWHEAKGVDESFAVTFKFPAFDVWDQLVAPVLKSLLPDEVEWHRTPPGCAGRRLADYLDARRRELASAIERLAADADPLRAVWAAGVSRDQSDYRTAARQNDKQPLQSSDQLVVSRQHALTISMAKSAAGADEVVLFHGATRAHAGPELMPVAQKLLTVNSFSVAEAATWEGAPAEEQVREFLAKLLRLGMLERAPAAKREQISSVKKALLSKWLQGKSS